VTASTPSRLGAVVSGQQFAQNQAAGRSAVDRGATLLHGASILDATNDGGTDAGFLFPAAVAHQPFL
jgi:aldehyde dehydrogenase (NAD+)